jgi:hypothetical protein
VRRVSLRRWLIDRIVQYLTEPLPDYERRVRNDLGALIADLRKADVILVEGDQRVSAIIRYLSQSCWSHSALYIGDELIRRGGERAAWARDTFGDEAEHLVVEALPSGVVVSPVAKYVDYNVRVCRPHRIRPEHVQTLMDDAVAAIGWRYDLRNVFDLARYLIPVSFVPPQFRNAALHFGSGQPTEVICSSLLARLFAKIRFPILPTVTFPEHAMPATEESRGRLVRRIFGQPSDAAYTGIFHMRHPTLITPRDFDLSPFFDIVKQNPLERGGFDYSRIHWDDDERGLDTGPGASASLRARS